MRATVTSVVTGALGTIPKDLQGERTEKVGTRRTNRDHPNYNIIKIELNTKKSPGDLRKIVVNQTYRTLHSYKLFWAVCHLFPRQRWRTHTYSVSGNHWPGEPRDMRKTTSARKISSCVWSLFQDAYFL